MPQAIQKITRRTLEFYYLFFIIVFTGYRSQLNIPEVSEALILTLAVSLAAWIVYARIKNIEPLRYPNYGGIWLIFLISLATSTIHAVIFQVAANEIIILILALAAFLVIYNAGLVTKNIQLVINQLLAVGGVYLVLKVIQIIGIYADRTSTCSKYMDAPNKTAAVAAPILFLALAAVITRSGRRLYYPAVISFLATFVIMMSQSRGGIVGAAVGSIVLIIYYSRSGVIKMDKRTAALAAVLILALAGISLFILKPLYCTDLATGARSNKVNTAWTNSISTRGQLARLAISTIKARPAFGAGPGNFTYLAGPFFLDNEKLTPHAHNLYLQLAAERGLIGLAALLLLAAATVSRLFISKDPATAGAALAALAAAAVHGIPDVTTIEPVVLRYLLAVVALALSSDKIAGNGGAVQPIRKGEKEK